MNKSIIVVLIILILFAGNIVLGFNYYLSRLEIGRLQNNNQFNGKISALESLFIEKVLKTQGEITAEDRLKLENAVFSTGDPVIVKQWQAFLASKTEQDAQNGALSLLSVFAAKIIY